jgi:hypothetical protein
MRRYGYLLIAGLFFLFGCGEFQQAVKDAKKEIPPPPRDNYIILLDLSDRILYNNQQQIPKDISVVNSIYGVFTSKLGVKDPTHLYYSLHDKLKLLIAAQKTTPKSLYDMVGSLRIDLAAEQPDKKAAMVDSTQKLLTTTLPEIYRQAVIGNNSTAYSGADIWQYFNEDLADDLEKDGQNTLFIITDGYLDLEKTEDRPAQNNRFASCSQIINALKKNADWETKFTEGDYGLLPIAKKFPNLKVVVLQVNPKEEWNGEYSLLTKIWGKWFTEMGIRNYRFIKNDNVNEVKESMEKFMEVKVPGKPLSIAWTKINTIDSGLLKATIEAEQATKAGALPVKLASPAQKKLNTQPPAAGIANNLRETAAADDPETGISVKKKANATAKKTAASNDDILKDAAASNGFNTGIKKETKKEPLTISVKRRQQ